DDARQTHGAAVDERDAPASAVDPEVRRLLHHAHIAPERELEAAGDRGPRHRSDHRLIELQARGAEGPARDFLAVVQREIDGTNVRSIFKKRRSIFEIPAGAERAAFA